MVRVAINGFGRIGRLVFRAGFHDSSIEYVAINDLTDPRILAGLLKYDSVHGKFPGDVSHYDTGLIVNGVKIPVYSEKDPHLLPWKKVGVDVVIESTGFFVTKKKASMHLEAGAKKVLISAPGKCEKDDKKCEIAKTIVMGVNEHSYDKEIDHVISNASCTTNCLAPMAKVLNDNFKIKNGYFLTCHGYTATQNLVDGPSSNLRRARSAAINLVPSTSGAAIATSQAIPELAGKMTGMAIRVPVPDGSITQFTCELEKPTTKEELNALFKDVSENHMKGIMEYTDEPLVSTDIIGNPHSVIFDSELTEVIDKTKIRIVGWYDNEWGYCNRLIDVIKLLL